MYFYNVERAYIYEKVMARVRKGLARHILTYAGVPIFPAPVTAPVTATKDLRVIARLPLEHLVIIPPGSEGMMVEGEKTRFGSHAGNSLKYQFSPYYPMGGYHEGERFHCGIGAWRNQPEGHDPLDTAIINAYAGVITPGLAVRLLWQRGDYPFRTQEIYEVYRAELRPEDRGDLVVFIWTRAPRHECGGPMVRHEIYLFPGEYEFVLLPTVEVTALDQEKANA